MFYHPVKILVIFICLSILVGISEEKPGKAGHSKGNTRATNYQAPGTVKFPLGDEEINNDILRDPSVTKQASKEYKAFISKCRGKKADRTNVPYVTCLAEAPPPKDPIYTSSTSSANPELSCKKCDLKLSPDGSTVLVHCFECYDLPDLNSQNRYKRDIVYVAHFLEIANYTSEGRF